MAMLKSRNSVVELKLARLPADERRHFLYRYADLQEFFYQSIKLNSPIDAL